MTEADRELIAYLSQTDKQNICTETVTKLLLASWSAFSQGTQSCEHQDADYPNYSEWPPDPGAPKDGTPLPVKLELELDHFVNLN